MDNITILFVDDEQSILSTLKRLFRREPYHILTADSGQQGLDILADNPVNIVISDMRMPHMNGAEFLQQVKGHYPTTKRIIMSGYADIEAVVDAVNKGGICLFISKPWDNDELKTIIANLVADMQNQESLQVQKLKAVINEQLQEINSLKGRLNKL